MAAAERAVLAAEELDDAGLLVEALAAEAVPLRMRGENAAALARYTRVLALADDHDTADRPGVEDAARAVARAYIDWVECARNLTGISWRELFGVLDAAERWLAATGRRRWRAGVLLQRASLHHSLDEWDAAVAAGQETLAAYQPDAAGYSLGAYRFGLGDKLRDAGRPGEAQPLYQAMLDDPNTASYDLLSAHRGLAWCALADHDPARARRHAATAVRLSEPLGDNALCTPLAVLVAACRAGGDLDAAWQAATRAAGGREQGRRPLPAVLRRPGRGGCRPGPRRPGHRPAAAGRPGQPRGRPGHHRRRHHLHHGRGRAPPPAHPTRRRDLVTGGFVRPTLLCCSPVIRSGDPA